VPLWGYTDESDPKEMARKMLADKDLRPFRDAVMWAAAQVGELRSSDTEAAAKN
jgi:hypothetical protein